VDNSCSTSRTVTSTSTESTNAGGKSSDKAIPVDSSPITLKNHKRKGTGLEAVIDEIKRNGDFQTKVVHFEDSHGKTIEEVYSGVHDGPILGTGISGLVRKATHKATGVQYAVKCLDLGLVGTADGLKQIREEIHIMCQLDHPNIVRLEEVYEGSNEIFLVQELCSGGELFDRLDDQPDFHFTETQCIGLVKQMLSAVRYMHSKGIVHRDIKLENFLYSTSSPDSELKMIDFGLSKHFTHGQKNNEPVGTPYTVAPEVLCGNYDEKVDVWAIGVITFLLLCGDAPFGGCGGPEPMSVVRENILKGTVRIGWSSYFSFLV
jgi:calcium-dependent protein kinase